MSISSSSRAARFLVAVALGIAMLWLAGAAMSYAVDASGLRRLATPSMHHACGPGIFAPWRSWKPIAYARSRSRTVLLGTSRVAMGIDPSTIEALLTRADAFNLGLEAATMPEIAELALGLMERRQVDHIVVGLDSGMFFSSEVRSAPRIPASDTLEETLHVIEHTAISRLALKGALRILRDRQSCNWPGRADDGFIDSRGLRRPADDRELDDRVRHYVRQCPAPGCRDEAYHRALGKLHDLVRAARLAQTRLTILINPVHAMHHELQARVLGTANLEQWKRDVAHVAAQAGGDWLPPVRDFSGIVLQTTRNFPMPPGAPNNVPGFIDFSHYSPGLGKLMLESLAKSEPVGRFGARLTPASVESLLEADRVGRATWVAEHPEEVARIETRMKRLRVPRRP